MARFVGIDVGAVSRLVDRLAAKGLITRTPDPTSRRTAQLVPALAAIDDSNDQAFFAVLCTAEQLKCSICSSASSSPPQRPRPRSIAVTDTPSYSITRTITIDRPRGDVHAYLADARHWPEWVIVNVLGDDDRQAALVATELATLKTTSKNRRGPSHGAGRLLDAATVDSLDLIDFEVLDGAIRLGGGL